MELWKSITLLSPPVQTTSITDNIDVMGMKHACDNITRVLSKQSPLHREGALLSRFIYKYDRKFRHDIGYRNIRKTNSALRKYLQINLLKDVDYFTAVLPTEDDDFVPTRQMLQYVLLRIITFSKLMQRVYVCSKQAAIFYLDRVKRGESHWMSLMPYALLSRIWSISIVLLQHATSWYSCLHPFLQQLQPKGLTFLPEGCELPNDLDEWLNLKNIDTIKKFHWSQRKLINIGLTLDDEGDSFDNIFEYASHINEENKETEIDNSFTTNIKELTSTQKQQFLVPISAKVDYGQAISRDSFKVLNSSTTHKTRDEEEINCEQTISLESKILTNFQKKISYNKISHYFGKVTNTKSLKDFLDKEEMFRNDGNSQSITKHLSFMQWHTLKSSLLKVCNSLSNNRKIERKLQKVWKEKCLDYL